MHSRTSIVGARGLHSSATVRYQFPPSQVLLIKVAGSSQCFPHCIASCFPPPPISSRHHERRQFHRNPEMGGQSDPGGREGLRDADRREQAGCCGRRPEPQESLFRARTRSVLAFSHPPLLSMHRLSGRMGVPDWSTSCGVLLDGARTEFARSVNAEVIEASAKTGEGVSEAFQQVVATCYEQGMAARADEEARNSGNVRLGSGGQSKKGCC